MFCAEACKEILDAAPIHEGYFALPAEEARSLVTNFREFAAVYVHLSDLYREENSRLFNVTEKSLVTTLVSSFSVCGCCSFYTQFCGNKSSL